MGRVEALPVLDILEKPSFAEKTRFPRLRGC